MTAATNATTIAAGADVITSRQVTASSPPARCRHDLAPGNNARQPEPRVRLRVLYAAGLMLIALIPQWGCEEAGAPMRREKLIAVLVDLHLVESRRQIVGDMPPETRDSVLAAHNVSPAVFERAVRYYGARPDDFLALYNTVIDSLSAELGELEESGRVEIKEP